MISVSIYKVVHLLGIMLVFTAVGGVVAHAAGGGTKDSNTFRKQLAMAHGIGLLLAFVTGFGLLARTGTSMAEGWVWGKVLIWLFMGVATVLPYRSQSLARALLLLLPLVGGIAAYLAIYKPF
jgi:hypothetical protein